MERSLSSCCRMKMKEDETRERNDKTGSVIAIDLSAISATVSHKHLREAEERKDKWQQGKNKTKRESS